MEIRIVSEKENPVLKRKELKIELKQDKTPTPPRTEIQKLIASHLNIGEDLVIIDKIFTSFGTSNCLVDAKIYEKKEDIPKKKIEFATGRLAKGKPKEEKKPETAEKPAEEKVAEESK